MGEKFYHPAASETVPTGEYEDRDAEAIEAGDRVFIDGKWQTVEAAGASPTGQPNPKVEITTEPDSEGYVFEPRFSLPVAVGEVDARPKGEAFVLQIELGNAAMNTAADIAEAVGEASKRIAASGSWEGPIWDGNGNTVGSYRLEEARDRG